MKQHAINYCGRTDGYEIWYRTQRQENKKFRFFETLEQLTTWCKRHKGKIEVYAGSWQALELLK